MYILEMNLNDGRKDTTRVCIGKNLFSDWGDQGTLAFNAAIILNSPAKPFPKIQNCGGNECQITLGTDSSVHKYKKVAAPCKLKQASKE